MKKTRSGCEQQRARSERPRDTVPSESLHPEDDEDDMCAEEGQTPSLEDRWNVRKSDVPSSIGSRVFEVRESHCGSTSSASTAADVSTEGCWDSELVMHKVAWHEHSVIYRWTAKCLSHFGHKRPSLCQALKGKSALW